MRSVSILIILATFFWVATPSFAAEKELKAQTICPIMKQKISKEEYSDYQGQRVYFCCSMCKKSFEKDPEKYLKIIAANGEKPEAIADSTMDHSAMGHH